MQKGRTITNLRYADDTTLLAQSEEELVNMVTLLKKHSSLAGLRLNTSKTKVLATGPLDNGGTMKIDGEEIEAVDSFVFLGAKITSDSTCEKEIRRRIAMGKCAVGKLMKIWKDRGVTKGTKVKLVKALVFPIVTYGSETWVIKKEERRRLDAFELWCWRRLLRISWKAKKINRWILEKIEPGESR